MLEKQRNEIDAIDKELVALFEKRMDAVLEIARIKKENQLPTLDQSREDQVIEKIRNWVTNKAYEESTVQLYKDIMKASRDFQEKTKK